MIKRMFLTVFGTAFLGACATTTGYDRMLDGWVGKQDVDLVRAWGAPNRTYEAGGRKFLTYTSRDYFTSAGIDPIYHTARVGRTTVVTPVGGMAPHVTALTCNTTFELEGSRIVSWSHQGNNCLARE